MEPVQHKHPALARIDPEHLGFVLMFGHREYPVGIGIKQQRRGQHIPNAMSLGLQVFVKPVFKPVNVVVA